MGASERRKGACGEREVAELLRSYGISAHRGRQYHGGADSPDVQADWLFHLEVKRTERLALWPALEQAERDCPADKLPLVLHRPSRKPWVAILRADALFKALGLRKDDDDE